MYNFLEYLRSDYSPSPKYIKGDLLLADYYCPGRILTGKLWSEHNFLLHVTKGSKQIETKSGIINLKVGNTILVRKGAMIIRDVAGSEFGMKIFFIPDEFIATTLKSYPGLDLNLKASPKVMEISTNEHFDIYINAIHKIFELNDGPHNNVLDLKFMELLYIIVANPENKEARSFFSSVVQGTPNMSMQRIMEDNFRFNFSLEEYSRLCNRSLSAFKRDFLKTFGTTPGKWIQERRLSHARILIQSSSKSIAEIAFSTGFENASHFSKSFRMKFGYSPMSLRRKKAA
jgi:AraC family transcriptional regulator, exoenzyme S synthesis regulatory protein ExsA